MVYALLNFPLWIVAIVIIAGLGFILAPFLLLKKKKGPGLDPDSVDADGFVLMDEFQQQAFEAIYEKGNLVTFKRKPGVNKVYISLTSFSGKKKNIKHYMVYFSDKDDLAQIVLTEEHDFVKVIPEKVNDKVTGAPIFGTIPNSKFIINGIIGAIAGAAVVLFIAFNFRPDMATMVQQFLQMYILAGVGALIGVIEAVLGIVLNNANNKKGSK